MSDRVTGNGVPVAAELDLGAWLAVAVAIVRRAGALVAERYNQAHVEDHKGHAGNLVTETDHASEDLIVSALTQRFPGHTVRGEEGRGATGGDLVWVVD